MQHSRALAPGTMVAGDWRIERMLGQGGFGVTYEARHRTTGARVALKEYMPSGLCTRLEGSTKVTPAQGPAGDVFKRGLASFMREAETLARLNHPSIVRVTGFFEANATAYMALAFETGGTLADWLGRLGRQPTQAELDDLLWPLIDALIQVHSLPLLHRDIKPDNIMLEANGIPVLIDFGAVKTLVSSATRSVGGPGTLSFVTDGYAPPEQYVPDGENLLGPWTDVYALGATIYEAITGARPPTATRRTIDESHRPLTAMARDRLGPGWRPAFLEGVDRALALRRSDRPQSMVEFRTALGIKERNAAQNRPPSLPTSSRQRVDQRPERPPLLPSVRVAAPAPPELVSRSKAPLGIAAALAAVLLGGGVWWVVHQQASKVDSAAFKAEGDRRIAEAHAARLEAEVKARRLAEEKAAAEAPAKAAAKQRERAAAEAQRKAQTEDRRPDPIAALVPGSGQSARDRLADGSECSFCPEMVVVPAGRFTMGSPASEPQRIDDEQQVAVSIPRPFAIGKFAVTFDEWDACVADGGCNGHKPNNWGWGRGKQPVIDVNWNDAKAYAVWLSGKTGKVYRLPSETEREYVTRAGTTTAFWWGNSINPAQANYDGSVEPYKGGGAKGEYRRQPLPVDRFPPNPWGLYQVHGNVWEWTEDCWIDRNTGNPGDGEARTTGCTDDGRRVVRGSSWGGDPRDLRSANRLGESFVHRDYYLGFRVARTYR